MEKPYNKVFGIGLSRTGTVSLTLALQSLGFRAVHLPKIWRNSSMSVEAKLLINRIIIKLSKKFVKARKRVFTETYSKNNVLKLDCRIVDQFDALTDISVTRFFKELDRLYPKSKFVLTIREMDSWLDSCQRHFKKRFTGGKYDQLNYDIYGVTYFRRTNFIEAYNRHMDDVTKFFCGREDDFFLLNVCAGEGFEQLCPFLGLDIPKYSFPHRRH